MSASPDASLRPERATYGASLATDRADRPWEPAPRGEPTAGESYPATVGRLRGYLSLPGLLPSVGRRHRREMQDALAICRSFGLTVPARPADAPTTMLPTFISPALALAGVVPGFAAGCFVTGNPPQPPAVLA